VEAEKEHRRSAIGGKLVGGKRRIIFSPAIAPAKRYLRGGLSFRETWGREAGENHRGPSNGIRANFCGIPVIGCQKRYKKKKARERTESKKETARW